MIELSVIRDLVTIFGVIAGFSYYVLTERANQKTQKQQLETRQAQLLMQIYDRVNNRGFTIDWAETTYFWNWTDNEDYWKKYGTNLEEYPKLKNIIDTYEGIGVILKNKLVEPKLIYGVLNVNPILYWEKFSPLMNEFAEKAGESLMYTGFKYLCQEMKREYEMEHGYKFGHKIRQVEDLLTK